MDRKERERMVALYRDGYRAVVEALHNVDRRGARREARRRASGRAREIVHHLADSEMTAADPAAAAARRRIVRRSTATIRTSFARRLHYDRPHESVARGVSLRARCTAQILERLTEEEWLREGTHTEAGSYGVEKWLRSTREHAHRHARQIVAARDAAVSKTLTA